MPTWSPRSVEPEPSTCNSARCHATRRAPRSLSIRGSPQSAALVDPVASRSEGNPLFTEELLAADATTPALPDSLRQLLLRPLAELPDPGRRVLATAALGGRVVDHRLVAWAADVTADELSDVIRHAVDHHILVAGTTSYAFRHALVREAIASTLLPGERVDVHRRLAEALADDPSLGAGRGPAISAELAHHWRGAGDLGKALTAHLQAGTAAEAFHAMDEAYRHFEAGGRAVGPGPARYPGRRRDHRRRVVRAGRFGRVPVRTRRTGRRPRRRGSRSPRGPRPRSHGWLAVRAPRPLSLGGPRRRAARRGDVRAGRRQGARGTVTATCQNARWARSDPHAPRPLPPLGRCL